MNNHRDKRVTAKKENPLGYACDLNVDAAPRSPLAGRRGTVLKYRGGGEWDQVNTVPYKNQGADWDSVIRRVLVGDQGEPVSFHLRYFEIAKGGFSSFERHEHVHVVIGVRGTGDIRIGEALHRIAPFDIAYVAGGEPHQLSNRNEEPFGFFCIVDAERDAPVLLREGLP